MRKSIRILTVLLLVLLCFCACERGEAPPLDDPNADNSGQTTADPNPSDTGNSGDSSESSDTDAKQTQTDVPLSASNALILAKKEQTEYTVVTDNQLSNTAERLINNFCDRFSAKTGAELARATDKDAETQKEILIYTMDERTEVQSVLGQLTAPEQNGYRIEVDGTKLIVACATESYLEFALELLDRAIRPCEKDVYGIEKDYVGKLDLPTPAVNINSKVTAIGASDGNYSVVVSNTDKSYYAKFLKSLKSDGFTEYSKNTIGDACFATYVKDSVYGEEAIYTMYYPGDSVYKMTYGPLRYLPELRATKVDTVTPSFAQTQRFGGRGGNNAPGLCCVVQCSDGKYIVFDGGSNNSEDKQILYNYLSANNPNEGKPTVAAWVITHAHGDHMGLANAFLEEYASKINLEMVIYNFPDFDRISITHEDPRNMKALTDAFKDVVARKFPNAKTWIAHTGEVMQFAGCKMEVLYTPEDYLTGIGLNSYSTFPWGNHTNTTYRLDINGTTVMMLGDSESTLNQWMARTYEEDLKSDILQLAHHGSNGGHISLYRLIDPDICIWPTEEARMRNSATAYDFNRYLVLPASEGGRDREHYTMDETVVYQCTDNGPVLTAGKAVENLN